MLPSQAAVKRQAFPVSALELFHLHLAALADDADVVRLGHVRAVRERDGEGARFADGLRGGVVGVEEEGDLVRVVVNFCTERKKWQALSPAVQARRARAAPMSSHESPSIYRMIRRFW